MILTKSLFVEFCSSPKLAWWHLNDKETYEAIQQAEYGDMDGMAIGQSVEDLVKQIYPETEIHLIDTEKMRQNWHGTYHSRTVKVMETSTGIIYQPAFMVDDLFVKCDFLVPDGNGKYDLVEVKAKNRVRKETKEAGLLPDLLADVSIQSYVLKRALGEKFSGRCFLAHLNKTYVKNGPIDPQAMIIQEEVTEELIEESMLDVILGSMRASLGLDQDAFNARFPYDGSDYLTYFGTPPPPRSIRSISRLGAEQKEKLRAMGATDLEQLNDFQVELLRNGKGEETAGYRYVNLRKQGETIIDIPAVQAQLEKLVYPLYFYDYETISSPIPVFDGTSPRQQVVVQYSLHKVEENGTITHFQGLLEPGATTNRELISHMLTDMDNCEQGTRVVRYKGFENSRNTEMGEMFPELASKLQTINEHTFDLMEIFSNQLYFDRRFEGSSSIKKVLPILTTISYDHLAVGNGAVAAELLMRLVTGKLEFIELAQAQTNLLEYCKQDTRAMVALRQKLQEACR